MKKKLFLFALTFLGFSGCTADKSSSESDEENNDDDLYDTPDVYGVPLSNYRFMGEVTDSEGNPIKGIDVKINYSQTGYTTDDTGAFLAEFTDNESGYHYVTFTDVDGEENGGEFATKQVDIDSSEGEVVDSRYQYDLGTVTLDAEEQE